MSSAASRFEGHHGGFTWAARAARGELDAVLYVGGPERENLLMHAQSLFGAKVALQLSRRRGIPKGVVLDFGCGTGRMLRFFGKYGWSVIGTEVTGEMLEAAHKFGVPEGAQLHHTDGVSIPVSDQSVDLVWVSGVLKYALFDSNSYCRGGKGPDTPAEDRAYRRIAGEMYRILKPGGLVVNVEMWVDAAPKVFQKDFEEAGFVTKQARVLRRYMGVFERLMRWRPWHRFHPDQVIFAGNLVAWLRYQFDDPGRKGGGMRDYLFVWHKPKGGTL